MNNSSDDLNKISDGFYACKNPRFDNEEKTKISLLWNHPEFGLIPFTASKYDTEEASVAIFYLAIAGDFGDVEPYIGLSSIEKKEKEVRDRRDSLLFTLDAFVSNPLRWMGLSDDDKKEAEQYRTLLLDIPQREGFPDNVGFPAPPDFLVS